MLAAILTAAVNFYLFSPKVGECLQRPDWMPEWADDPHTYGNVIRLGHETPFSGQASARITDMSQAGLTALFDGYLERMYCGSVGSTNDWDGDVWGPVPTNHLYEISWTNGLRADVSFRYLWPSNSWPTNGSYRVPTNHVIYSRRFLEGDNIERLTYALRNFTASDHPMMERPSWGSVERRIAWSSSAFEDIGWPWIEPFGWTDAWPRGYSVLDRAETLAHLDADDLFNPAGPRSKHDLLDPFVERGIFQYVEGETNSVAYDTATYETPASNTVPDLINRLFDLPTNTVYPVVSTRRLLPDHFSGRIVQTVTNRITVSGTAHMPQDYYPARPPIPDVIASRGYGIIAVDSDAHTRVLYRDDDGSVKLRFVIRDREARSMIDLLSDPIQDVTIEGADEITLVDSEVRLPHGRGYTAQYFDQIRVLSGDEYGVFNREHVDAWWFHPETYRFDDGWRIDVTLDLDVVKPVTQTVETAASPLASAGRYLAVLDRTLEVPVRAYHSRTSEVTTVTRSSWVVCKSTTIPFDGNLYFDGSIVYGGPMIWPAEQDWDEIQATSTGATVRVTERMVGDFADERLAFSGVSTDPPTENFVTVQRDGAHLTNFVITAADLHVGESPRDFPLFNQSSYLPYYFPPGTTTVALTIRTLRSGPLPDADFWTSVSLDAMSNGVSIATFVPLTSEINLAAAISNFVSDAELTLSIPISRSCVTEVTKTPTATEIRRAFPHVAAIERTQAWPRLGEGIFQDAGMTMHVLQSYFYRDFSDEASVPDITQDVWPKGESPQYFRLDSYWADPHRFATDLYSRRAQLKARMMADGHIPDTLEATKMDLEKVTLSSGYWVTAFFDFSLSFDQAVLYVVVTSDPEAPEIQTISEVLAFDPISGRYTPVTFPFSMWIAAGPVDHTYSIPLSPGDVTYDDSDSPYPPFRIDGRQGELIQNDWKFNTYQRSQME